MLHPIRGHFEGEEEGVGHGEDQGHYGTLKEEQVESEEIGREDAFSRHGQQEDVNQAKHVAGVDDEYGLACRKFVAQLHRPGEGHSQQQEDPGRCVDVRIWRVRTEL